MSVVIAAVGAVTGIAALLITWLERRRRITRDRDQDRAAAETPLRQLRAEVADLRLVDPTSATTHTDSDDPIVWTLRLTNPSAATLTVLTVNVTHHYRDGLSTTPWGIITVNRTVDPGQTLDLPGQRNPRPRARGPHPAHETFDLVVRDTTGRTWHRDPDGTLQLIEGAT